MKLTKYKNTPACTVNEGHLLSAAGGAVRRRRRPGRRRRLAGERGRARSPLLRPHAHSPLLPSRGRSAPPRRARAAPPRPHVPAPRARRLRPAQEEPAARDVHAAERKPGRSRSRRCRCRFAGDGRPLGGRNQTCHPRCPPWWTRGSPRRDARPPGDARAAAGEASWARLVRASARSAVIGGSSG